MPCGSPDTGKGIPRERLERVFDPFTQLEPRERDAQGGLGVGLALVRYIVELHGGTIKALSLGVSHGSEFVVTLPLMRSGRDAACYWPRAWTNTLVSLAS